MNVTIRRSVAPLARSLLIGTVLFGFTLAIPAGPARAEVVPDPGPGWTLVNTRTIREFVRKPEKIGAGDWELVEEKDRKYFLADALIEKNSETQLVSSQEIGSTTVKSNEQLVGTHKVPIKKDQEQGIVHDPGPKAQARRTVGNFLEIFEFWDVKTYLVKTITITYQIWETWTFDERVQKLLERVYKTVTQLAWQDPITGEKLETKTSQLGAPVQEVELGPLVAKKEDRPGAKQKEVTQNAKLLATNRMENLLSRVALGGLVPSTLQAGGLGAVSVVGYSGNSGRGAAAGRSFIGSRADVLSGATEVKAAGKAKSKHDDIDLSGTWTKGLLIAKANGKHKYIVSALGVDIPCRFDPDDDELEGKSKIGGIDAEVELKLADSEAKQLIGNIEFGEAKLSGSFNRL